MNSASPRGDGAPEPGRPRRVYTIGHGTRPLEELAGMLGSPGVELLIDVRRYPGSRRNPQYTRESLEKSLPGHGISYRWRPELGGRRTRPKDAPPSRHSALRSEAFRNYADYMDTEDFRLALGALKADADSGVIQAVMCAETLWWRCHRRHIADALLLDGFEVIHLVDASQSQPHELHEALRQDAIGRPVYDVGATQTLLDEV